MSVVNFSSLRAGDEVTVRLIEDAPRSHAGAIGFWVEPGANTVRFSIAVLSHKPGPPPPLRVGDKVRKPGGEEFEIVAGPKRYGTSDSTLEYAVWSENGYRAVCARDIDTWERV